MFEINSVIVEPKQLMDHGLVCPLVQQRRHWILSTIQNQDRCLSSITSSAHLLHEQCVLLHLRIKLLCKQLAYLWAIIIPDFGILSSSGHQHSKEPLRHSIKGSIIIGAPVSLRLLAHADHRWNIKTKETAIDSLEIEVYFLQLIDNIMNISLSQPLYLLIVNLVGEV